MFNKKDKIEKNSLITELINGLDLYYLIVLLKGSLITIIELGKETLYEGNASNYNCKRLAYEVIKFEKIHYDNTYEITVKKVSS